MGLAVETRLVVAVAPAAAECFVVTVVATVAVVAVCLVAAVLAVVELVEVEGVEGLAVGVDSRDLVLHDAGCPSGKGVSWALVDHEGLAADLEDPVVRDCWIVSLLAACLCYVAQTGVGAVGVAVEFAGAAELVDAVEHAAVGLAAAEFAAEVVVAVELCGAED